MKIYVASHSRALARLVADDLTRLGHQIISSWVYAPEFLPADQHTETERENIAERDVQEVLSSDVLVLVSGPDKYTGGKFVETGIAIGAGKQVFIIGRRENMLCWHPSITVVSDADQLSALMLPHKQTTPADPELKKYTLSFTLMGLAAHFRKTHPIGPGFNEAIDDIKSLILKEVRP